MRPKRPTCCGAAMVLVRQGERAGFSVELWRCLRCEAYRRTSIRIDGQNFWVGAMGAALHREGLRLIADAYGVTEDS